jgi:PKHD-type hydroxylase
MLLHMPDVLDGEDLARLTGWLNGVEWIDGQRIAAWQEKPVKHNEDAPRDAERHDEMRDLVRAALMRSSAFVTAARPKRFMGPGFIRYAEGRFFGNHIDDPIMGGVRTDLSVTVFLTPPESYEGGDMVIETASGEERVRLPAGHAVVYPSTSLHRVEPVTRGSRLVAAAWVRSLIRDAGQREMLMDLDEARQSLFRKHGAGREQDLLAKTLANLMRQWAED